MIDADVGWRDEPASACTPGPPSAGPTAGNGYPSGVGQGELCACEDGAFIGGCPQNGKMGVSPTTRRDSLGALAEGPRQTSLALLLRRAVSLLPVLEFLGITVGKEVRKTGCIWTLGDLMTSPPLESTRAKIGRDAPTH